MLSMLRVKVKDYHSMQLGNLWIATDKNGQYVKDPSNTTVLTQITQIEQSLLECNAKHLAQAKNTPCARTDLQKN